MKFIKIKKRKPNRSLGGDIGIYIMLILFGIFFVLPLVYSISSAFKPLDEIYLYPPRFFVKNPTFNNFQDLLVVMSSSYVPFTRYVFNTVLTTLVGTVGHLIVGSMAAYVLAKYDFPGSKKIFKLIQSAIMFNAYVIQIPTYLVLNKLGWIDSYLALIAPALALPMGLFLMKQFMEQIPDALIEAAKIDGGKGIPSDCHAECKTGVADRNDFFGTELMELERSGVHIFRRVQDAPICLAADYVGWCIPCRRGFCGDNGCHDGTYHHIHSGRE